MKLVATTAVMFLIMLMHEAEGRRVVEEMNILKKVKAEQAFLLGSSLPKGGKPPSPSSTTQASTTISQRHFAAHSVSAAHPPPPPRPTAHSNTMQLLFSMPATATATARQ